ncbi:MAG: ArdC family protein, partial [Vibrionaceae bacterium]
MAGAKKSFHEIVAENLIKQLEAGTAPWQKPWDPGAQGFMPINPTTGNRYKGINAIFLMAQGFADNRWLTYKQAEAVGAQVRKGEKGAPIQYWMFSEEQTKRDDAGKPMLDAQGLPLKTVVMLERPRVFFATVFNGEQIDGLPPPELKERIASWQAIEKAERILRSSGADIRHSAQDRAFYRLASDSIHLPHKEQFPSADNYYATALHELGHWTGHNLRLNRDIAHPFGSQGYAKEELKAECFSLIMGEELGVGHDPKQHAAYVGSWIALLKNDPLEIFRATADAEKMVNYVMAFEQKLVQEQGPEKEQKQEKEQVQIEP